MAGNLISVIVPCFNQSNTIGKTLDSIINQTYSNWECIIVNDGSTDDSLVKIQKYTHLDLRFKLVSIKNGGVSNARNVAIMQSTGEYIFPLDGDDYISEDCLEKCILKFISDSNLKLVCPQGVLFGNQTGIWELPEFDYKTMLKYNMVHNSSMYLKKDFESVGGYRTNMVHGLEDWDFFIALLYGCKNEQVVKINEPLFFYRVNNSGRRLKVAASLQQNDMRDLIIYNNFSIYQEYFPRIFDRIHEYDYNKVMINKLIVKMAIRMYNKAHKIKSNFLKR